VGLGLAQLGAEHLAAGKTWDQSTMTGKLLTGLEKFSEGTTAVAGVASFVPFAQAVAIPTALAAGGVDLALTAARGLWGNGGEEKPVEGSKQPLPPGDYTGIPTKIKETPKPGEGFNPDGLKEVITGVANVPLIQSPTMKQIDPPDDYQVRTALLSRLGASLAMADANATSIALGKGPDINALNASSSLSAEANEISAARKIFNTKDATNRQLNIAALYLNGKVTSSKIDPEESLGKMTMYYDKLASDTARYNAQLRLKASQSGKKTIESMYNKTGYSMKDRNVRVKDLNTHISNLYKTLTDGQNKDKNFYYSEQGKQMNNEIAMAIDERNNLIKENNDISTAMNIYYKYVSSGAIASPDGGADTSNESEESDE
jgi:hypothetical protein